MSHRVARPERDDRADIRAVIETWAVARDAGDWERLRRCWHAGGTMAATMFQGSADAFIELSRRAFERGVEVGHFLGGTSVDVAADHAVAQTKMTITQRAVLHDVLCDVVCTGRFYDFFQYRENRWGIVRRQPIYERDRLETVEPNTPLALDRSLVERFPKGYRYLAYLQSSLGMTVKADMPGLRGPEVDALYREGAAWLAPKR